MFDCDKILLSSDELFYESLMFFGKAFQNTKLIRLATQILNNIVSEITTVSHSIKCAIESFISVIYNQLEAYSDEFVLDNLIGVVITLIIKFDNPDSTYEKFLKSYG
jgi:phosphoglycolate phosphatase-like HAD superfamily hydrolase